MSFPRRRTLAGLALVALGLSATTAQAAPTDMVQNLRVTISPTRSGTRRAPRPAAIGVTISSPTENPATTETVVVRFGKGVEFNNRLFPVCSAALINARRSIASCPRGSIVGRGTARALGLVGSERIPARLRVTAVNSSNNSIQLFVSGSSPVVIASPISGRLVKGSGRYGYQLNVRLPQELQEIIPGTAWGPLTYFDVRVKATTTLRRGDRLVRVPYVATVGCPRGGWPFAADFTFDQGAPFVSGPISAVSPVQRCR